MRLDYPDKEESSQLFVHLKGIGTNDLGSEVLRRTDNAREYILSEITQRGENEESADRISGVSIPTDETHDIPFKQAVRMDSQ